MGFVQGLINSQIFTGDNKPLTVDNSHIFTTTIDRDNYFVANPSELVKDIYIQIGTGFQRYSGSGWVDVSSLLKGLDGVGIPILGTPSQILRKKSDNSYDTEWVDKFPIRVETDSYIVDVNDYIVICNFATEKNITLPSADIGKVFIIKAIGEGNITFLTNLDGISNFKLYKGGSVNVVSDGTNYYIVASAGYGI